MFRCYYYLGLAFLVGIAFPSSAAWAQEAKVLARIPAETRAEFKRIGAREYLFTHDADKELADLPGFKFYKPPHGAIPSVFTPYALRFSGYRSAVRTEIPLRGIENLRSLTVNYDRVTDIAIFKNLTDMRGLKYLDVNSSGFGDEDARALARLDRLVWLDMSNTFVSDEAVEHLANLKHLRFLNAGCAPFSREEFNSIGFRHLRGNTSIETLQVGYVTDDGMRAICEMRGIKSLSVESLKLTCDSLDCLTKLPKLQSLTLHSGDFGDRGLAQIAKLKGIKSLEIAYIEVTDNGIIGLAAIECLENIVIHYCDGFEGPGFRDLSRLKKLKSLAVDSMRLDDEAIQHFSALEQLEVLQIDSHKVTDAGIARLQKSLPKCKINE